MQLGPDFNAKFCSRVGRRPRREWFAARPRAWRRWWRERRWRRLPRLRPDIMHNVDLMSEEVAKTKSAGIACIVDAGHADMGRDINFIRQVSMKSGVPIVAGGGFYSQPFYPKEISTMSEEQIVKALIKQADDDTLGVFGEIGSWDEITADERKVFRAVLRSHRLWR